jgi:hypothetical protein
MQRAVLVKKAEGIFLAALNEIALADTREQSDEYNLYRNRTVPAF